MSGVARVARPAIVLLWVVLVGALARDSVRVRRAPAPVPAKDAATLGKNGETWTGVYLKGRKIGYSRQRFEPDDDGFRFAENSLLRLTVMEQVQLIHLRVEGRTDKNYALRSFSVSLDSGVGKFEAHGTVRDKDLQLRVSIGGKESTQSVPLADPIYLQGGVRRWLVGSTPAIGTESTVQVFDPTIMQNRALEFRVEGRELLAGPEGKIQTWRIREESGEIESRVWVDEEGDVVREEGPMGLVARRESPQQALSGGWDKGPPVELMSVVAVPVRHAIQRPRDLGMLKLRVGGIPDVTIPADRRQTFKDGILTIVREDGPRDGEAYVLPYRGGRWDEALRATPFLQSDNARIRKAAREALGGETEVAIAAAKLRHWVFQRLDKVPTASIPNALQVLDMGRGDCNEHAVLFGALARASGLPARLVTGAVYVNGVFLYHAWNEVWLGSGWMSVDATLDQMPADATHIKFVEGGLKEQFSLLRVIGRLKLDVLATG